MRYENETASGLMLALGAVQFLGMMMLLEAVAPGYSMHDNAISDLGTIPQTRLLFNLSLVAIGAMNLVGGLFLFRELRDKVLFSFFLLGSIGAMGAALVPLDSPVGAHGLFALIAFLFTNLEIILIAIKLHGSMKVIGFLAGVIGLIFLGLMVLVDSGSVDVSGSIGHGGAERMIAYPTLLFLILFGGYLMARPSLRRVK